MVPQYLGVTLGRSREADGYARIADNHQNMSAIRPEMQEHVARKLLVAPGVQPDIRHGQWQGGGSAGVPRRTLWERFLRFGRFVVGATPC
jgi:hypothetical protein